jgi:hypothetical protein
VPPYGRGGDPEVLTCTRSDGAILYWDTVKQALVVIEDDKITTYFRPDRGFDYWLDECSR